MKLLRLQREPSDFGATIGALYLNDRFVCWTLEPVIREPAPGIIVDRAAWVGSWKVKGQTAIPAGRYPVVLEHSARFNRKLPELKNVPGFDEIKIHGGNSAADTEGCPLVGILRGRSVVQQSQMALTDLLARLAPFPNEVILIDVLNPPGLHFQTQPGTPRQVHA